MRLSIKDVVDEVRPVGTDEDLGLNNDLDDRYLLVERNLGSGAHIQSHWFSTHPSRYYAGDYHDTQESADDWLIVMLVDLETGKRWQPITRTDWKEQQ